MYMGMGVEFDFEVPPIGDFARRVCKQVEVNIENSKREERVQRKRRELRERIKVQIITSPYTVTPRASIIDSNRRDSMTLPLERGSFTPFQKVPFRRQSYLDSNQRDSTWEPFGSESFSSKSLEEVITTAGEQCDRDKRFQYVSSSFSNVDRDVCRSSAASVSSNITLSTLCSPPIKSTSPNMKPRTPTKSLFIQELERDESCSTTTRLTSKSNAYVTAINKIDNRRQSIASVARALKEEEDEDRTEELRMAIPEGSEYVEADFYWVVDFRGTEKAFDSDAFTFAGMRFRLTFSPSNFAPANDPHRSKGYSLLLALAQSHGRAYVACEFSVHGLLRPIFCRKCTKNLHFTPRSSVYRGYRHFMGPELLSYLENGTFTFSVLMKTYIGPGGELLGLPDPLAGGLHNLEGKVLEENDSEVASHVGSSEVECRMEEIYPKSDDRETVYTNKPFSNIRMISNSGSGIHRNSDIIGNNTNNNNNPNSTNRNSINSNNTNNNTETNIIFNGNRAKTVDDSRFAFSGLPSPAGDAHGSSRKKIM